MMKQVEWFERAFDFSNSQNIFPSIIERLIGTPIRLQNMIDRHRDLDFTIKYEERWSINENIGHLIDLEPLWQGRLMDILENKPLLREADLNNRQTHESGHNLKETNELLSNFKKVREKTTKQLLTLSQDDVFKTGLHPRLLQPMRTMDLFLFVAEHDDHHLVAIRRDMNR